MDTITIPRDEYTQMKEEIQQLKNTKIYKRLLEFEKNIAEGRKYTRADLGF
jgi:PHD/YefM family antitoxin component YafN of YafNO toxin-antitoxin module